ncbi:hypothetical protein NEF87_005032 [Candidatus Lokiarchaeum ossiferum]|uniref:Uncharacterized protein n=1 Tax=Candidatus Lokiarchaeum ossiferum TaxID=2951803 RepID=A0ABY6I0W5_9ARCH|nr:hypothetical protein NEF87_005032 [Candidatus Lokiarchaeum sp. B-35]
MRSKNLEELWILSSKGEEVVHIQKIKQEEEIILIRNFFSGIHQFMQDMGGSNFYHLNISGKDFIGININIQSHTNDYSFYLIGKFEGLRQKRCLAVLSRIKKQIIKLKWSETKKEDLSDLLTNLIRKIGLF